MTQSPMRSPCINICQIDPKSRLCLGCYRTMDEIATWSRLTDQERDLIMAALPKRQSRQAL